MKPNRAIKTALCSPATLPHAAAASGPPLDGCLLNPGAGRSYCKSLPLTFAASPEKKTHSDASSGLSLSCGFPGLCFALRSMVPQEVMCQQEAGLPQTKFPCVLKEEARSFLSVILPHCPCPPGLSTHFISQQGTTFRSSKSLALGRRMLMRLGLGVGASLC